MRKVPVRAPLSPYEFRATETDGLDPSNVVTRGRVIL